MTDNVEIKTNGNEANSVNKKMEETSKSAPVEEKKEVISENNSDENKKDASVLKEDLKNGKEKPASVTDEIKSKIQNQIHYYFGDYNLPRDKFLREEIKKEEGWIPMTTMLNFKRLASFSKDVEVILDALSSSNLIEVDSEKKQIRRSPKCPLPDYGEDVNSATRTRTVYFKGFPKDGSINLDVLLEFFEPYGPFETVRMRHFHDKIKNKHGFKGSVLVVFPTDEKAKEIVDIDDLKYKKGPLIVKHLADYLVDKKNEIQERIALKEAKKKKREEEAEDKPTIDIFPRGGYVHISGVTKGTKREDIKESLSEFTDDVAFIDFQQGDVEGYFRLGTANSAAEFVEKREGKVKVGEAECTLRTVEGEEEDEQLKKALETRNKLFSKKRKNPNSGGRGFHKRKRAF